MPQKSKKVSTYRTHIEKRGEPTTKRGGKPPHIRSNIYITRAMEHYNSLSCDHVGQAALPTCAHVNTVSHPLGALDIGHLFGRVLRMWLTSHPPPISHPLLPYIFIYIPLSPPRTRLRGRLRPAPHCRRRSGHPHRWPTFEVDRGEHTSPRRASLSNGVISALRTHTLTPSRALPYARAPAPPPPPVRLPLFAW